MKRKYLEKKTSARNMRPWEKKNTDRALRTQDGSGLMVTEGLALHALMQLGEKKDKDGVPLTTYYGIWMFIKEEFGMERFSAGVLRHALYKLEKMGAVTPQAMTKTSEGGAQRAITFYKISEHTKPENLKTLLQQAKTHWEREKKLSGKG